MVREKNIKQYFCSRCGTEIKTNIVNIFSTTTEQRRMNDRGISNYPSFRSYECLCNKCNGDMDSFMKRKYPSDESKKVIKLEEKLREISDEVTADIDVFSKHISVLAEYAIMLNKKVNGSPYLKDLENQEIRKCLREQICRFLETESEV